jgi:hypothetical protein
VRQVIASIENEYFPDESSKFGLFRIYVFYVDIFEELRTNSSQHQNQIKNSRLDLISLKISWRGGVVLNEINPKTTHCIIDKK